MKKRRAALDIKKKILQLLKEKSMTLRELETKANTNNITIITQVKELEYFGLVKVERYEKNKVNGRPYSVVRLS